MFVAKNSNKKEKNHFDLDRSIIKIYDEITVPLSLDISNFLCDLYNCSLSDIKNIKNNKIDTLYVEINSPGGDAYTGLTIYDILTTCLPATTNIVTIGVGLIASAATIVYCAGKERLISQRSRMMLHEPMIYSVEKSQTIEEVKNYKQVLSDIEKDMVNIYSITTKKKEEEIKKVMLNKDFYLIGEASIKFGLSTRII
jgi:ATP-dependent Clp protease protease subunit